MDRDPKPTERIELRIWSKWVGIASALSCGALIAGMTVFVLTMAFPDPSADPTERAMGIGLTYFIFIPLAAIPVAGLCLTGVVLSTFSFRKDGDSRHAYLGWLLSLVSPLIVVAVWVVGLFLLD